MATDVYKLEWTRSRSTIQTGVSSIMHKDAFMDTIIVCSDGAMTHNKLTLGLVLPELHKVAVFDLPVEHTLLMPDYSTFEIQSLIGAIFPQSAEKLDSTSSVVRDQDVELLDREEESGGNSQFSHFLGETRAEGRTFEPPSSPYGSWTGARRGRGRPPLSSGARLPARFQCDYCNKGFYYRSMLTAHEKLHTGGTRETCEVCGAEYSTRQNLKNHMIKYHGADSFTPRKRGRPPVAREGIRGQLRGISYVKSLSEPSKDQLDCGASRDGEEEPPPLMLAQKIEQDNSEEEERESRESSPDDDDTMDNNGLSGGSEKGEDERPGGELEDLGRTEGGSEEPGEYQGSTTGEYQVAAHRQNGQLQPHAF